MEIQYPQINWQKIVKECPVTAKAYLSFCYRHRADEYFTFLLKGNKQAVLAMSQKPYEVMMWLESKGMFLVLDLEGPQFERYFKYTIYHTGEEEYFAGGFYLTRAEALGVGILKAFELAEKELS